MSAAPALEPSLNDRPTYDLAELARRDLELAGRPAPTPRFMTRPPAGLPNRAAGVETIARAIGAPLIPWQTLSTAGATTMNPPGSLYFWRYQLVIVVVPRQSGKTKQTQPILIDRAIHRPGSQIYSTAQLGKYASARWSDSMAAIESSFLKSTVRITRGKGSECATFLGGSTWSPFPPGRESLHSTSPNAVLIDEAWAFNAEQGKDLMTAIRPAMITKHDRQLWVISAAGDDNSAWLDSLIEAGRASVDDPNSTTFYLEYSIPDDADPYDPKVWEYHPGLGHLITLQDLAGEVENNTHAEFVRNYMNRSTRGNSADAPIDLEAWSTLELAGEPPAGVRPSYGFGVSIDRRAAAIWAAWRDEAGLNLRVVDTRPDVDWLVDALVDLHSLTGSGFTCIDGPASLYADELRRRNHPVDVLDGHGHALAWDSLKSAARRRGVRHDQSPALAESLRVVVERTIGNHLVPSYRHSVGPIDALDAAVAAGWAAEHVTPSIGLFRRPTK